MITEKPQDDARSLHAPTLVDNLSDARQAFEAEQHLTIIQSLKLYPYGCLWSILLSCAIIMEGYDLALLGGFFGFPAWNEKFGTQNEDGKYGVSASWQTGLTDASLAGNIFGLVATGVIVDRFGCRKTMIGGLTSLIGTLFILFFAPNLKVLVVGQFFVGMPLGVFQTLTVQYAAEVCPLNLRHVLTAWVNLSWVIGQFLSSGVLRACLNRNDVYGYKIPYAIQWAWPVPVLIGCLLAPESPWWLVRKGRIEEAKRSLNRLTSKKHRQGLFNVDQTVALMQHTIDLENAVTEGTTYQECFKGVNRRRTEISCMAQFSQNLVSPLIYQSTYFMINAGLSTDKSFDMGMAQSALGFVGVFLSMVLMGKFGRRPMYLIGFGFMAVVYFIVGFLGLIPDNSQGQWAVGSLLIIANFTYQSTVGPTAYAVIAEIPSNRLRGKTLVLSRIATNCLALLNGYYVPEFINPTALNWGAKAGWFFAGTAAIAWTYMFFRLPEPKGRSYGEIDVLFHHHVAARKFKSTQVDQFAEPIQHATSEIKQEEERLEVAPHHQA